MYLIPPKEYPSASSSQFEEEGMIAALDQILLQLCETSIIYSKSSCLTTHLIPGRCLMHACTVNSSHCIVYAAAAAASCTGHYHHNFEARSGKFGRQDHRHTQTDERRAQELILPYFQRSTHLFNSASSERSHRGLSFKSWL